ncbi:hypothetical protein K402DRAFT_237329 [Aulographum hederae CBS 113979]|uniref:Phosphatidate cytidylyltransferase n=1 Tax=Aulographum hederae CBS 113979 TaxID=1176131 RepID=A0A6G1GKG8_9PEZI|nr:hypothetical protein K402DRAFT_237329 [Aulographum hederae CBS 113979]
MDRSPSPLGLIPIHQKWRSFVHRHEVPRKILHTSIAPITLALYLSGIQPSQIHPILLSLLIPIFATDLLRHRSHRFNRFYISCLGALMRESEVDGYNGVVWYLLGAWISLRWFPKDVGVVSVLLLSWCDTAASTFGRLWGRYTPKVRTGKSLAGSLAAMIVGVGTAAMFWGVVAPIWGSPNGFDGGEHAFAFQGTFSLPANVRNMLGWTSEQATISGGLALGIMSVWAGFVASAAEAVDLFSWDDNLTIPVLCGVGLWGFLKTFA